MNFQIYGGRDPRDVPAYSVQTASYLLGLSPSTLQKWVAGRPSRKRGIEAPAAIPPIIQRPEGAAQLSFTNLIEAHILSALRRHHHISIVKVRRAVAFLQEHFPNAQHPLAEVEFQTDGVNLFIEAFDEIVNVSAGGQLALRAIIEAHLQRVEHDDRGLPIRLFPFVRGASPDAEKLRAQPRVVVIDPRISFGKPVIAGTAIPTYSIAERYKAGENVEELADDYECNLIGIQEAIRYELHLRAA